jgi:predicted transcriptional regulator
MPDDKPTAELLELTTKVIAAHVANNPIAATEVPGLIVTVHETLAALGTEKAAAKPEPAVSIKQSVKPDYIVCLEDGKKLKMLKRHLKTAYNMTPAEYRERWGLARDYPMVAPNYAKTRSELAKKIGLGRRTGTKVNARRKPKKPSKA